MRLVSELYGRHPGADIYVVGTGASMRVFPPGFLEGRISIALNLAWQLYEPTYAITSVPRLNIPEFISGAAPRPAITWVTKPSKIRGECTPDEAAYADAHFYGFETDGGFSVSGLDMPSESGRVLDWVRTPHPEKLYLWTSISQTAINLAANMGARNVILVGCDNSALVGNHHAQDQHTMWKGENPNVRYMQYYEGIAEIRTALRPRGVNVVSLTPFAKLDDPAMDFERLCVELERQTHIANVDIPRGDTLADDNRRYMKVTRYIIRKDWRHFATRVSSLFGSPPQA